MTDEQEQNKFSAKVKEANRRIKVMLEELGLSIGWGEERFNGAITRQGMIFVERDASKGVRNAVIHAIDTEVGDLKEGKDGTEKTDTTQG